MKNKNYFILIFLLGFLKSYSQSDFREGYIIKPNNDTLYGIINYKGNKANSNKCVFKKDIDSNKIEFTPNELLAYRFINSKYYISKQINFNDIQQTIFLEYLKFIF